MDLVTMTLIGNVANAVIKYGVPAVHTLVDKVGSNPNPTSEDFMALVNDMRDAEGYFEKEVKKTPAEGEAPPEDAA